ncbi:MAG: helix-turn-helix transcriptional regulator [Victivallaceae bacterium]|nr:helix-turn-helix transcriptional regulator [Victivallaceae bacterium]
MDKIVISDANIDHRPVHTLPQGIRKIHRQYGLWICKFYRGKVSGPDDPDDLSLRYFEFYDLSHMFDGDGWYAAADGKIREVKKGSGILVTPGFKHKYGGGNKPYIEDSISFYGPLADHLFSCGIIKNGILKIGTGRRLLPIIELALDSARDAQIKANLELQKLLIELYFENKSSLISENPAFVQLLEEIKKSPGKYWDLDSMAAFCSLSVSQLNRIFKKETGITAKNYIDNLKMQLASEMLARKTVTVKDIAAELGYPDPYHFSRRFKELKGFSPQRYKDKFLR